jgi:hypothetical protein
MLPTAVVATTELSNFGLLQLLLLPLAFLNQVLNTPVLESSAIEMKASCRAIHIAHIQI